MKIDQLPTELLIEIFKYLPEYAETSLVNKRFCSVARKMDDPNIVLCLQHKFFNRFLCDDDESFKWLPSILTSNREISKVRIEGNFTSINDFLDRDQRPIISIVKRFSATIKHLTFINVTIDESMFFEILSHTPNIKYLDIRRLHFSTEEQSPKEHRRNFDSNLKTLKSLVLVHCGVDICDVFVAALINRQSNIKHLKVRGDNIMMNIRDKLKLESLDVDRDTYESNSVTIADTLMKQPKLESLVLTGVGVDDGVMDAVTNLLELQTLKIDVSRVTGAPFVKFSKLKNLQDLKLIRSPDENTAQLKALIESDNTSIRKLRLSGFLTIPVKIIESLASSTRNLTHFNMLADYVTDRMMVDAIMRYFNFLEVLRIAIWCEPIIEPRNYLNSSLRELELRVGGENIDPWLTKLVAAYPNITKIKLSCLCDVRLKVEPILKGFTKLESLVLSAPILIVDDLYYLADHKHSLQFVSLGLIRQNINGRDDLDELTGDLKMKLQENFGVMHVDCDRARHCRCKVILGKK